MPGFGFSKQIAYQGFVGGQKVNANMSEMKQNQEDPSSHDTSDNADEGSYSGFGTSSADSHSEPDTPKRYPTMKPAQQSLLSPNALRKEAGENKVVYSNAAAKMMVR